MDLVRDVLDKQLLDRDGRKLGKVDGIVLELRDDGPPRVAFLENGLPVLMQRLMGGAGDLVALIERQLGIRKGGPVRIPMSKVIEVGIDVRLDLAAADTEALAWEEWVGRHVIRRIPGSGA
jgi:sporulation protein YlmC with PRC-barrel domain